VRVEEMGGVNEAGEGKGERGGGDAGDDGGDEGVGAGRSGRRSAAQLPQKRVSETFSNWH